MRHVRIGGNEAGSINGPERIYLGCEADVSELTTWELRQVMLGNGGDQGPEAKASAARAWLSRPDNRIDDDDHIERDWAARYERIARKLLKEAQDV